VATGKTAPPPLLHYFGAIDGYVAARKNGSTRRTQN
jgi:hypothetical protein